MYEHVLKHMSFPARLRFVEEELERITKIAEAQVMDKKDMELLVEPIVLLLGQAVAAEGLKEHQDLEYSGGVATAPVVNRLEGSDKFEFEEALRQGKIHTIKWLREKTGWGLKESKDECERVYDWNGRGWLVSSWTVPIWKGELKTVVIK
jgi:ribosomal protein L7/L12